MSQLVVLGKVLVGYESKFAHSLLIPATCAFISIALLVIHVIITTGPVKHYVAKLRGRSVSGNDNDPPRPISRQNTGFVAASHSHIEGHGGGAIFVWKLLRLLACMALTGLTMVAITSINEGHGMIGMDDCDSSVSAAIKHLEMKHKEKSAYWFGTSEWIEVSLCLFYVSCSHLYV